MPLAASRGDISCFFFCRLLQAILLHRIGQVRGGETVAEKLGECAAMSVAPEGREIIVDVGLTIGREEEHPVLLDRGPCRRRVPGQFGETWVGFQRTKRGSRGRRGKQLLQWRMQPAEVDQPKAKACIARPFANMSIDDRRRGSGSKTYCVLHIIRGSPLPLQKILGS